MSIFQNKAMGWWGFLGCWVGALVVAPSTWSQEVIKVYPPYKKPTLIAHRGSSFQAPEHTIVAYSLALEQGADFIEPDLQITKDGVLVCLHDTTLERTTNAEEVYPDRAVMVNGSRVWPVADFTLEEIQRLDAGAWKDVRYTGLRVPTFEDVIRLVRGKAGLIPETKAPEVYGQRGMDMEALLMKTLQRQKLDQPGADPKTPVVIQSFSAASLQRLRKEYECQLPLVYLVTGRRTDAQALPSYRAFADGIAPNKSDILARPELVQEAHALGLSVTVWTFRADRVGQFPDVRSEMDHFLNKLQVDALFTDNPDQFPRCVGEH